MRFLSESSASDTLQLWSGFLGALLSGLVMVAVLIVTLVQQSRHHRDQLEAQADQFASQQKSNESLLRTQIELEREEASRSRILSVRSKIMIGLLDLERIAFTRTDFEKYGSRRYEVLALNREVKSLLKSEFREDYKALADLQDIVGRAIAERVNAGLPTDEEVGNEFAKLLALLEDWTDAYISNDCNGMESVNKLVQQSMKSFRESEEILKAYRSANSPHK